MIVIDRPRAAAATELTWQSDLFAAMPGARVTGAHETLHRLSPRAAFQEALWGRATLVDIRPETQRLAEGSLPKSLTPLAIEHSTVEGRLDPTGHARLPIASTELRVILMCQEGEISASAADALSRLGVHRATDVIGGFAAWRSLGLPVAA